MRKIHNEKLVTEQKESSRFVSGSKGGELHWKRGGWMGCCVQWRQMCWSALEKMSRCKWAEDLQDYR